MSQGSSKGLLAALIVSLIAVLGLLVGGYTVLQKKKAAEADALALRGEMEARLVEHQAEIAGMEENFQAEIQRINEEWSQKLAELKQKQQQRVSKIYDQINEIVYDADETVKYLGSLERKLREGNDLAAEEVEALETLSAGLTYLHRQYSKPIHEFKELDLFLASQLDLETMQPEKRFSFFKRIFSKSFRSEEQEYYKDVGKAEAFEMARNQVAIAYANAQKQMDALALDSDNYLQSLQNIIENKERSIEELDAFFGSSRRILDIHQEIMDLQEEKPPPDAPIKP